MTEEELMRMVYEQIRVYVPLLKHQKARLGLGWGALPQPFLPDTKLRANLAPISQPTTALSIERTCSFPFNAPHPGTHLPPIASFQLQPLQKRLPGAESQPGRAGFKPRTRAEPHVPQGCNHPLPEGRTAKGVGAHCFALHLPRGNGIK